MDKDMAMTPSRRSLLTATAAFAAVQAMGGRARAADKLQFRLNWTLYGEHAPFFVALDRGFYRDEGLDVEILEGSGSNTVAQLTANGSSPLAYVDAATLMRGVTAGMPIKAVGVSLQQTPLAFIYRADAARPTRIEDIKGSRIAITAGDSTLAIFTALMGKLKMPLTDVKMIVVANPQAKEQAVLSGQADALLGYFMDQGPRMQLRSGVRMAWTRFYDLAGLSTLSSAIIVNNDWARSPANQDLLRRFLRASQRGWDWADKNREEAAKGFLPHAPAFNLEIALLELEGTMSIVRTPRTKDKPTFWTAREDWQESQEILQNYANLPAVGDVGVYYTNEYLTQG